MSFKRVVRRGNLARRALAIAAAVTLEGMLAITVVSTGLQPEGEISFKLRDHRPPGEQDGKRTIYQERDFHWKANLKAGQTLEVINRNGEIEATGTTGAEARVEGTRHGGDDDKELFFEVVEYPDGVTICAVYAKDQGPGRCHKGGVSGDWSNNWHGHHAKVTFQVEVPAGVQLGAKTTNGDVHGRDLKSVVDAATTNGSVEISTSEWASAKTTNGGVRVSMGNAKWNGRLELLTTNGGIEVTMPASSEFEIRASTTNGNIRTDFPITVDGNLSSKNVSGKVGGGGRDLRVATTNGGIQLNKS